MTEEKWLSCRDPSAMLWFASRCANHRQLRRFLAACPLSYHLFDPKSRNTQQVMWDLDWSAYSVSGGPVPPPGAERSRPPLERLLWAAASHPEAAANALAEAFFRGARGERGAVFAELVREIFGNPFRSATVEPAWRTSSVLAVAQAVDEGQRWADLPVLADALEEAGCTDAAILSHLRRQGGHVRGCWALDAVLGNR